MPTAKKTTKKTTKHSEVVIDEQNVVAEKTFNRYTPHGFSVRFLKKVKGMTSMVIQGEMMQKDSL